MAALIEIKRELTTENKQLRSQLLSVPIKDEGTVGVAHLNCHLYILCVNS